jgi:hypothetical protein
MALQPFTDRPTASWATCTESDANDVARMTSSSSMSCARGVLLPVAPAAGVPAALLLYPGSFKPPTARHRSAVGTATMRSSSSSASCCLRTLRQLVHVSDIDGQGSRVVDLAPPAAHVALQWRDGLLNAVDDHDMVISRGLCASYSASHVYACMRLTGQLLWQMRRPACPRQGDAACRSARSVLAPPTYTSTSGHFPMVWRNARSECHAA